MPSVLPQVDAMTELDAATRLVEELEARAKIFESMEQMRAGCSSAMLEDFFRRERTRTAYFSVSDVGLRKELISACRRLESVVRKSYEDEVAEAERGLQEEKRSAEPWLTAAVVGVVAVGVGHGLFGVSGALAGAVGGAFLGMGLISDERRQIRRRVEEAERRLERARVERSVALEQPEYFDAGEQLSGVPRH